MKAVDRRKDKTAGRKDGDKVASAISVPPRTPPGSSLCWSSFRVPVTRWEAFASVADSTLGVRVSVGVGVSVGFGLGVGVGLRGLGLGLVLVLVLVSVSVLVLVLVC